MQGSCGLRAKVNREGARVTEPAALSVPQKQQDGNELGPMTDCSKGADVSKKMNPSSSGACLQHVVNPRTWGAFDFGKGSALLTKHPPFLTHPYADVCSDRLCSAVSVNPESSNHSELHDPLSYSQVVRL